jgi:cytochrome c oxidase cbb3-type subunit 3
MRHKMILPFAVSAVLVCAACQSSPGRPGPGSEVMPPSQITDFNILFAQNCSGCHGPHGQGGAAIALANPVFLAIADDAAIGGAVAVGVAGTPMAAFAQSAGGMLTDKQVLAIVKGIRSWAKPDALGGEIPPPYRPETPGDAKQGAGVYATYCSACHGPEGRGGKASSIVNGAYLALVSDQNLRTVIIAGRPELGAPDWRGNVPGKSMSAQEISDVVAWLAEQRSRFPGQPYPNPSVSSAKGATP